MSDRADDMADDAPLDDIPGVLRLAASAGVLRDREADWLIRVADDLDEGITVSNEELSRVILVARLILGGVS